MTLNVLQVVRDVLELVMELVVVGTVSLDVIHVVVPVINKLLAQPVQINVHHVVQSVQVPVLHRVMLAQVVVIQNVRTHVIVLVRLVVTMDVNLIVLQLVT